VLQAGIGDRHVVVSLVLSSRLILASPPDLPAPQRLE
jgi:hypothetical protein